MMRRKRRREDAEQSKSTDAERPSSPTSPELRSDEARVLCDMAMLLYESLSGAVSRSADFTLLIWTVWGIPSVVFKRGICIVIRTVVKLEFENQNACFLATSVIRIDIYCDGGLMTATKTTLRPSIRSSIILASLQNGITAIMYESLKYHSSLVCMYAT